jgi:hypothetical protein
VPEPTLLKWPTLRAVFHLTSCALADNPVRLLAVVALLVAAPSALITLADQGALGPALASWWGFAATLLALLFLTAAAQVFITLSVLNTLNARRLSFRSFLASDPPILVPVCVSVTSSMLTVVGLVAAFVPGALLMCMWAVTVSVAAFERTTFIDAFRRSLSLTRTRRWRVGGVIVGLTVITAPAFVGSVYLTWDAQEEALTPARIGFAAALDALSSLVTSAGTAALYVELRRGWEGEGSLQEASAFD